MLVPIIIYYEYDVLYGAVMLLVVDLWYRCRLLPFANTLAWWLL